MDKKHLDLILEGDFDFDIREAIESGWETYKKVAIYSISFTLLIVSLQFLFMYYAENFLFVYSFFLAGPLFAGFYLVANKISHGEQVIYPDFFKGFNYYLPVVLVWIVGQVITVLGIFALILPGIYFLVGYMFSILITIFSGLDFGIPWNTAERLFTKNGLSFFFLDWSWP